MLNHEKVREWLENADGYCILAPRFWIEMGIDESVVSDFNIEHSDDAEKGKHAAHRSDGQAGPVQGVAEFDMIYIVMRRLGVNPNIGSMYLGRGKRFRAQKAAVLKALKKDPVLDYPIGR